MMDAEDHDGGVVPNFRKRSLVAAFLAILAAGAAGQAGAPKMRAHFIDVGQGSATLLEFPCGMILVDTGAQDEAHVERMTRYIDRVFALRPELDRTLEAVIVTHSHIDHTRGLPKVMERYRVRRFLDSGFRTGSGARQATRVAEAVETRRGGGVVRAILDRDVREQGERQGLRDTDIDPLACPECDPDVRALAGGLGHNPGWPRQEYENPNNHSIVLKIAFGESSVLITGDLEAPAIERLVAFYEATSMLDSDLYVVGHHGSHNGTTQPLLDLVTPTASVISVGRWDFGKDVRSPFTTHAFGHPNKTVVEMLAAATARRRSTPFEAMIGERAKRFVPYTVRKAIYATGWDGNLVFEAGLDGRFQMKRWRL